MRCNSISASRFAATFPFFPFVLHRFYSYWPCAGLMPPFATQFLFSPLSFKANPDTIDCPYPIPPVPPALENASVVHNSTVSSGKKISEHEAPKKKRSRITKEQLVHLERFFAADSNPTTARRREISLQIEIPERQVRVWFQNRYIYSRLIFLAPGSRRLISVPFLSSRAKAKSIGSLRSKTHRTASPLPPPPELGQATQVALATLLQEDDREYEFRCVVVVLFLLKMHW